MRTELPTHNDLRIVIPANLMRTQQERRRSGRGPMWSLWLSLLMCIFICFVLAFKSNP